MTHLKTKDVYKDILKALEERFDTLKPEIERSLTMLKNQKILSMIKDELGVEIMKEFAGLR